MLVMEEIVITFKMVHKFVVNNPFNNVAQKREHRHWFPITRICCDSTLRHWCNNVYLPLLWYN